MNLSDNSRPVKWLARAADWSLSWLYPDLCQVCKNEKAGKAEGYVGPLCRKEPGALKQIRDPFCERCGIPYFGEISRRFTCGNCGEMELCFRRARSAVLWTPFIREIVHRYKYEQALWHEPFLAELLVEAAAPILKQERWDMIVPIPLHRAKQRKREFNQAQRLAKHLSKATGIPMRTDMLQRVVQTRTQTRLNPKERAENVRTAFAMKHKNPLGEVRIVLVDDVLTTGATANACSKLLMRNGAACVDVWTVARGVLE